MNKTVIAVGIVLFTLGFFLGRLTVSPELKIVEKEIRQPSPREIETGTDPASDQRSSNQEQASVETTMGKTWESEESKDVSPADSNTEPSKIYVDFQEFEHAYETGLSDILEGELQLDDSYMNAYREIKGSYQSATNAIFNSNPDNQPENGDILSTSPEQDIQLAKIKIEHLKKLEQALGSKAYAAYNKYIKDFNDRQRKLASEQEGVPFFMLDF